jgi:hypothetical protein
MKNIPFIRKLKHLQKQYQRDLAAILPYTSKEPAVTKLLDSLHEMGMDLRYNYNAKYFNSADLAFILSSTKDNARQRRFSKLCRRLGKAAKKQGKLVYIDDIWQFVRGKYKFDYKTGLYSVDARDIPFHSELKPYEVTMRFIEQVKRVVWAESAEAAKEAVYYNNSHKHKDDFMVDAKCTRL